jgi:SAM-dependent methyltransferase
MAHDDLVALAKSIGDDWRSSDYYELAEKSFEAQWQILIWPLIKDCDFSIVVDLGAGHGRNTDFLLKHAVKLYAVDINVENIEYMKNRFGIDNEQLTYIVNNGIDIAAIADGQVTFVYSFDSMVHFDSDVVRAYLKEFQRILKPGGYGFCHYSNNSRDPTGSFRQHPGWRNFMSKELFEHYAYKEGLVPVKSELIDWMTDGSYSDAVTLFRKPTSTLAKASWVAAHR